MHDFKLFSFPLIKAHVLSLAQNNKTTASSPHLMYAQLCVDGSAHAEPGGVHSALVLAEKYASPEETHHNFDFFSADP